MYQVDALVIKAVVITDMLKFIHVLNICIV